MRNGTWRGVVGALCLLSACSSEGGAPGASATGKTSAGVSAATKGSATSSATGSASNSAGPAPSTSAAKAKPPAPSSSDKSRLAKHLAEGRKLSKKKDYKAAIAELEKALEVSPKDARVLGEIGWAALHDGDLKRAKDANRKALASTAEPKQRAQVLYNIGRVAEEEKDNEAAKRAYGESLVLRDNAEVKKRFEAVGGDVQSLGVRFGTCTQGHDSIEALCGCLKKHSSELISMDSPATCELDKAAPKLGDPRLSIVRLRSEEGASDGAILIAKDGSQLRAVANLGEAYEPGAFGVHNTVEVTGSGTRKLGDKTLVIVKTSLSHNDSNLAGLELCHDDEVVHALCVLGTPTTCRPITVEMDSGCGPGVEPDPKDMDEETKAAVEEIRKNATQSKAKASYEIEDSGKVKVKLVEGSADMLPRGTIGELQLFPETK